MLIRVIKNRLAKSKTSVESRKFYNNFVFDAQVQVARWIFCAKKKEIIHVEKFVVYFRSIFWLLWL